MSYKEQIEKLNNIDRHQYETRYGYKPTIEQIIDKYKTINRQRPKEKAILILCADTYTIYHSKFRNVLRDLINTNDFIDYNIYFIGLSIEHIGEFNATEKQYIIKTTMNDAFIEKEKYQLPMFDYIISEDCAATLFKETRTINIQQLIYDQLKDTGMFVMSNYFNIPDMFKKMKETMHNIFKFLHHCYEPVIKIDHEDVEYEDNDGTVKTQSEANYLAYKKIPNCRYDSSSSSRGGKRRNKSCRQSNCKRYNKSCKRKNKNCKQPK